MGGAHDTQGLHSERQASTGRNQRVGHGRVAKEEVAVTKRLHGTKEQGKSRVREGTEDSLSRGEVTLHPARGGPLPGEIPLVPAVPDLVRGLAYVAPVFNRQYELKTFEPSMTLYLLDNEILTPQELAKALKVSRVYIYKLVERGDLPYLRVGGKVIRFNRAEIEAWLEESRGRKRHRDKS